MSAGELWATRWAHDGWMVAEPERATAEREAAMFAPGALEIIPWPGAAEEHAAALAERADRRAVHEARRRGYRLDGTRSGANTEPEDEQSRMPSRLAVALDELKERLEGARGASQR